ncbi:MAG: hypothetical protein AAFX53_19540 [Bacteroidota bacterium]
MKIKSKFNVSLCLLFISLMAFSQKTQFEKNRLKKAVNSQKNSNINKLKDINEVGKDWAPYYNKKKCFGDDYDEATISMEMGGKTESKKFQMSYISKARYNRTYGSKRLLVNHFFIIRTSNSEIDTGNNRFIDDFQYVIATQENKLFLVKNNSIVEVIDLTKLTGANDEFSGKRENGDVITLKMNPCVIIQ